mmetsp:Transcript_19869/g.50534  ORF Transcript_19869/g.50534 Transcript_19869/m.50534 type:complete len:200 (+) Transcript_19869:1441-2040(+)
MSRGANSPHVDSLTARRASSSTLATSRTQRETRPPTIRGALRSKTSRACARCTPPSCQRSRTSRASRKTVSAHSMNSSLPAPPAAALGFRPHCQRCWRRRRHTSRRRGHTARGPARAAQPLVRTPLGVFACTCTASTSWARMARNVTQRTAAAPTILNGNCTWKRTFARSSKSRPIRAARTFTCSPPASIATGRTAGRG